ncbi:sensor histidine kinase [Pseudanabaena sp. PCC 6802]|uniref:sensor histidine kinase n=1 Tax=Pseudanabaena sp. PCC 6802 TaxID=118173 RepID=UPI0003463941
MFQTTRRRLALWYTMVTAVLLLLFASGFYGYVRLTLIDRIDDTITHVAEVLERSLLKDSSPNFKDSFSDSAADLEDDRIEIEWFSPRGDLLWTTMPNLPIVPLPKQSLETMQPTYRTVYLTPTDPLRQITEPIASSKELLGFLRISHPWFEVTKPIQQLFLDLTVGTTIMVVVVALCGWWLSGIAMEPVRDSYQRLKQFTADASHELRNPIAVIQTNAQVALADLDPAVQYQQLEIIERLTRRLGKLLDDLLFLARQDSGIVNSPMEPCNLYRVLHQVVEEQQIIAQAKQIELELSYRDINLSVLGNSDRLMRLFTNLIGNAIAYTPNGGKVSISYQIVTPQNQIQVQVRDTGVGIPESALPHIFDRFYRHQPQSTGGSGLGLAIAKAIADNHRGQIKVESSPGTGTIFTVTLPQAISKIAKL